MVFDGKLIGMYWFVVNGSVLVCSVDSWVDMVVCILGIFVYCYWYYVEEWWEGDCLCELNVDMDDDGKW